MTLSRFITSKFQNTAEFDSPFEADRVAQNYLEVYKYNVAQVISSFKDLSLVVDASSGHTVEILARLIKIRLNKGSQKPLRMLLHSPSNPTLPEFKERLRTMFGVIIIDLDSLLLAHINNKTLSGKLIVEAKSSGMPVPESVLIDIIQERIEKVDCRINGFVLDLCSFDLMLLARSAQKELSFHMFLEIADEASKEVREELKRNLRFDKVFEFTLSETPEECLHRIFFDISHFYD